MPVAQPRFNWLDEVYCLASVEQQKNVRIRGKCMKHGLAILTYVAADAPPNARRRLPEAVSTLEQTAYPGRVVIADDGSECSEHRAYLATLARRYEVIERRENGGISRAKNSCLRALSETDIDVGFIAEDDVEFRAGWWQAYLEAHRKTGIHHFSWSRDHDPGGMVKRTRTINEHPIVNTSHVNGVLLTFTPKVIETVGGFRILPANWGHEHTNWTRRIIAARLASHFCDIVDSNRFLRLNRFSDSS